MLVTFGYVSRHKQEAIVPALKEFLTVSEAAAYLEVSPNTLRNWGREGKVPEHRHPMNNYRLFKIKDLDVIRKKLFIGWTERQNMSGISKT